MSRPHRRADLRAKLMRHFVAACRTMSPLVAFATKALDLKFLTGL